MEKKAYLLTDITPQSDGMVNIVNGNIAAFLHLEETNLPQIIEALTVERFKGLEDYEIIRDEIRKQAGEILEVMEGKKESFTVGESVYTLRPVNLDADTEDVKEDLDKINTLYLRYRYDKKDDLEETGIYSKPSMDDTPEAIINLVQPGKKIGLSHQFYFPFEVENKKAYMFNPKGERCGGPFISTAILGGHTFNVIEPDGKSYIVDIVGTKLTGDNVKVNPNDSFNGYTPFRENDKWGFIHDSSNIVSPVEYDEIDIIEMGEPVHVKKDGEWGYLAKDFTFIPESRLNDDDDDPSDDIFWRGVDI